MPKGHPITRGIRNKNPGNIRRSHDGWRGLARQQTDPAFFVFTDAKWGIRALAKILRKYEHDYDLGTVAGIIKRWAPSSENDTRAYVNAVCKSMNVGPDEELDMHSADTLIGLCKAIIQHENGQQPYDDMTIAEAVRLAME